MQLTIDFDDAGRLAALAHIAEVMEFSANSDNDSFRSLDPHDVISAMRVVLEAFDDSLSYIDSPYGSDDVGKDAGSLGFRMIEIGQRLLDMKNEVHTP